MTSLEKAFVGLLATALLFGCTNNHESDTNAIYGEKASRNDKVTLSTVSLTLYGGAVHCSGTYIGGNTIVTAAHCILGTPEICKGYVAWGPNTAHNVWYKTLVDSKAGLAKIKRVVHHKMYNDKSKDYEKLSEPPSPQYDVAVINFEGNPPARWLADKFVPVPIVEKEEPIAVGQPVIYAGFGRSAPPEFDPKNIYTGKLFYDNSALTDIWKTSKELVISGGDGSVGGGDSGGPLYIEKNKQLVLAGIISRAYEKSIGNEPFSVFQDARYFRDWIERNSGLNLKTREQTVPKTLDNAVSFCN